MVSIYCIEDINDLKYIGSTKQKLSKRFSAHKSRKKNDQYCSSSKLDLDNCKIFELERCDEEDRKERERYWINNIHCVNELKLNFDLKEYCKHNKEYHENKKLRYEWNMSWKESQRDEINLLKIDVNLFQ